MARELPRNDDGTLQAWAWPGGYPIYYLDGDNSVLCPLCATVNDTDEQIDRFRPQACGINYEDMNLYCEECQEYMAPAYPTDSGFAEEE